MSDIRKRFGKKGVSWQVRYADASTGQLRYKSFPRRKDADLFLSELSGSDFVHDRDTITVSKAGDRWLEVCELTGRKGREPVEPSTLRKYKLHDRIISTMIGGVMLNALTPVVCNEFRDALLGKYSRKYAKKILTSFKSILSQARTDEHLRHDPAENTSILISLRTRKQDEAVIPSIQEVSALIGMALRNKNSPLKGTRKAWSRYAPFFLMLVFSGMRPCEVLGLPWREVDFEKSTATVSQDATEERTIGLPKSGASYRTIPLPDILMAELKDWKETCPESDDDLVFPNWQGHIESHGNITNRGWYPLQKQCGLVTDTGNHKFALKSLRHVRASLEIHEGATPKEIQRLMGHSSINITFDIYGHLFQEHEGERAERANKIADQLVHCGDFVA